MNTEFSKEDALRFTEIEKQQAIVMKAINAIMGAINPYEDGQDQIPILKKANDEMKSLILEKKQIGHRNGVVVKVLPDGVRQDSFPTDASSQQDQ
jgi:hypothetical protein